VADLLLHPAVPLLVAALACLVVPARTSRVLVVAAPLVSLVLITQLEAGASVTGTYLTFDVEPLRVDRLATAFGYVFAVAGAIAGTFGLRTQSPRERASALAYAGAAMGVVFAGDLLSFFVAWEVKAIASTFLILQRRGGNSSKAGMRYLFVHVLGGKLLLAGVLWHLADTGSLAFTSFDASPATVLILLACAVSAAIPPLHAWLPDAYPEASVAGTVFLSAYTTKAAVYALARGFAGWEVLVWVGVFMALYGVVFAMIENDIRRLLGYHIVSQVGFMVAAIGVGTELAVAGATAHAFAHILYKGLLLMGVGAVIHATGRSKMTELGGLANRMRPALALYMVGAVSISGFPLFSGFVSKELAVEGASVAGFGLAVLLLKLASVGTFLSTGIKLPLGTWFGSRGAGPRTDEGAPFRVGSLPPSMYVAMGTAAALNLLLGLYPALLYDLLPHEVTYDVYSVGKVVETSQILLFTALAAWVLVDRIGPKAARNLDTDWVYRGLPALLRARRPASGDADGPTSGGRAPGDADRPAPVPEEPAPAGVLTGVRTAVLERVAQRPPDAPPPVLATWALGVVVLGVGTLLLLLTLVVGP
jgi:multicomponent Na+:H+ antiporter subunit D